MSTENKNIVFTFKNNKKLKNDKPSNETIHNSTQDINIIYNNLKEVQKEIENCESIEQLNSNIKLKDISRDLGLIIQNSVIIDDLSFKKSLEELNQLYRDAELLYFNKKIELLNAQIQDYDSQIKASFKESEDSLKDITNGTLFSIASVFLGISLTSALVAGVEFVKEYIILYFMTCLLVAVITIGLSAIFLRKFDKKSQAIMGVIIIVSLLWICTAFINYNISLNNHKDNECSRIENIYK